jgi:polysaccharide export outer membrane protein
MTRLIVRLGIATCFMALTVVTTASLALAQAAAPTSGNGKPLPPVSTVGSPSSPSAPSPSTPSSSTAPALPNDYRLAAGDKLRVEVYKDTQLSQSLQIRPDGKVTLPLIGDIVAVDLTPIQLRDRISTSLKEYVTNPVVTVIVVEASPTMVYVMGEVATPGSIPMRGPMTVLQALAMAGGFKEFANTKDIRILRRSRGILQTEQTIPFNYNDAIKGKSSPVYLMPGDMVVVP